MRLKESERLIKLSGIVLSNAGSLLQSIFYCIENEIGSFRVNSQILPLKTHPLLGYNMDALPQSTEIIKIFSKCRQEAEKKGLRLTFHPDQFVILNSPDKTLVEKSIQELEYQAEICEWIGADVINIHGGGGYGDKQAALERLAFVLPELNMRIRKRLTVENDDRVYTPSDLLPFCEKNKIPFVYDIHHHRCLKDGLTVEEVTRKAVKTWDREPLFHISSPRDNYKSKTPRPHADFIDMENFPDCWKNLRVTIEVEAKAKEEAVIQLKEAIAEKYF